VQFDLYSFRPLKPVSAAARYPSSGCWAPDTHSSSRKVGMAAFFCFCAGLEMIGDRQICSAASSVVGWIICG
jgi:hypothetical protein